MLDLQGMVHLFTSQEEVDAYASIHEIGKVRIGHEMFLNALAGIKQCMKSSVYEREPMNCMLLGDGGMGKTSLAKVVMNLFKSELIIEKDLSIRTVPTFYTSFKSARTLDALTTDILAKLNDPHPTVGKMGDKTARVLVLLKKCRTKILFIDELHDLDGFEERDMVKMKGFFKWLKEISNECGPMICLMGIRNCHDVFVGDTEMSRRFKMKYFLNQLAPGTRDQPGYLQDFLSDISTEIVEKSPITSCPDMGEYLIALQVFAATGGIPDYIMTLLKESVREALINGRTSIEVGDFSTVWEAGTLNSSALIRLNPFLASENQIASALRKTL